LLGALRFILATLVVLNHLWLPTANRLGAHAVACFYIISGFLMTKVIHEVYGLDGPGARRFLINRFLRIFPPYWFFLCLAFLLLVLSPGRFDHTYSIMILPGNFYDFFRNVTLFQLPWSPSIVIPTAWSLTVEVYFYIFMVALLSRSRRIVVIWFLASLAYTIWLLAIGAPFGQRYTPPSAASLFFSTGAMIYFFRPKFERLRISLRSAFILLPLFCFAPMLVEAVGLDRFTIGFYGPVALFMVLFVTALNWRNTTWYPWDKWLGDLAYPVFITHYLAAGMIYIVKPDVPFRLWFFIAAYALCILISGAFIFLAERTLDPLRTRIRGRSFDQVVQPKARPASAAGPGVQQELALKTNGQPCTVNLVGHADVLQFLILGREVSLAPVLSILGSKTEPSLSLSANNTGVAPDARSGADTANKLADDPAKAEQADSAFEGLELQTARLAGNRQP
jgi:peptidoglycan/LPS O-acetylase OafA/YrhL